MKILLDTNVLVAAVTRDTDRSDEAIELLDQADDPLVSVLSLMELRSVLSKKKQFERDRIDDIENRVTSRMTVTFPDASDMMAANRLQSETLLYPMDAMILSAADAADATLVSFDSELVSLERACLVDVAVEKLDNDSLLLHVGHAKSIV